MSSLVILTPNPFPIGNVATNRLTTYAKALARFGDDIGVVVLKGTEDLIHPLNPDREGVYDGIWYEYMAESSFWDRKASLPKKLALYASGLMRAFSLLRCKKPDSVLLYSNDIVCMVFFYIVSRVIGFRYLIDKSEYPVVFRRASGFYKWFYLKSFSLFDGVLVMTSELKSYYSSLKKPSAAIYMLPMSVDFDRFNGLVETSGVKPYVACVYGVHNRDCIADTILAFDLFCSFNSKAELRLKLIGDFKNLSGHEHVVRVLESCKFRERIDVCKPVCAFEMPQILFDAQFLITTPRRYESGGFPTKLGEYLATGRVVIATEVGELSSYLASGDNVVFCHPGDIDSIAKSIEFAWRNPDLSKSIGIRGKRTAYQHFNVHTYMDQLRPFLYHG